MSFGKKASAPVLKPLNLADKVRKTKLLSQTNVEPEPRMKSSFTSVYQFTHALTPAQQPADHRLYHATLWVVIALILALAVYMVNPALFDSLSVWPFS
jgi:hypothetical protein